MDHASSTRPAGFVSPPKFGFDYGACHPTLPRIPDPATILVLVANESANPFGRPL